MKTSTRLRSARTAPGDGKAAARREPARPATAPARGARSAAGAKTTTPRAGLRGASALAEQPGDAGAPRRRDIRALHEAVEALRRQNETLAEVLRGVRKQVRKLRRELVVARLAHPGEEARDDPGTADHERSGDHMPVGKAVVGAVEHTRATIRRRVARGP